MAYQSSYSGETVDSVIRLILSIVESTNNSDLRLIGAQFMGIVASTSFNPGTPTNHVYYLANLEGTYTNFGGLSVVSGELAYLAYEWDSTNNNWHWVKYTIIQLNDATVIQQINAAIEEIRGNIEELMLGNHDHMAAAWVPAAQGTSPTASKKSGDMDLIQLKSFLIDHSRNTGDYTVPLAELKLNNWFRDKNGNWAQVVGISQADYDVCMTNDLYDNNNNLLYASGTFNPATYCANHVALQTVDGIKKLVPTQRLYLNTGVEVSHYLMPWECVKSVAEMRSIMCGFDQTLYFIQNAEGLSGNHWSGIFMNPKAWDGVEMVKMPPTAFAPGPSGVVYNGSKYKMRNFFTTYAGLSQGSAHCDGYAARGNAFKQARTYPTTNGIQAVLNMQWGRNNNSDPTKSYPFSEGGFPMYNLILSWLEVKYGTRDLHAADLFTSGISSNDSCNNEANWAKYGGVKWKRVTDANYSYSTWGTSTFSKTVSGSATNWSDLINYYYAKESCLESQLVASFATEWDIDPGDKFEFYGNTYSYEDITRAGVLTLKEGHMNCVVHRWASEEITVYSGGSEVRVEANYNLRMGLAEGMNISGDIFEYIQGGVEVVGTNTTTTTPTTGEEMKVYTEYDQKKWHSETAITKNSLGEFDFESQYQLRGINTNTGDGYSTEDFSMTPWRKTKAGGLHSGMCHYTWCNNYWSSTVNQRVRVAMRFRGDAHDGYCSSRILDAYHAASNTYVSFGGSAQVLIQERAS